MVFAGVNYLAVVLAAATSFVFGGIWYGALSRPWMEAASMDAEKMAQSAQSRSAPWPFIIAGISLLLMSFMLAGVMGHLGTGQVTMWNGLISAFFVWLGFVITTLATNHGFQEQPLNLTLIDGGHWLGVLLIQGVVIGALGV